jgi:uncharacterized protein (DUF608 family)
MIHRRDFLKQAAGALGAATHSAIAAPAAWPATGEQPENGTVQTSQNQPAEFAFPRKFTGRQLKMISFPLGGVAAGSLGLGGRGQLRDWEIFNRPHKGSQPPYAFPAIWAQAGDAQPVARVLESRILPPYEGSSGLGSDNVPGLSRLESAVFRGNYPLAHIDFHDDSLPIQIELNAFSPFIPHDPDNSGLPVAVLRYRVSNPGPRPAQVAIAFSIDNPVRGRSRIEDAAHPRDENRLNEFRSGNGLAGLIMSNPDLAKNEPTHAMAGEFVLAAIPGTGAISHWNGWPKGRWWNAPLLFWDQFSATGELGEPPAAQNTVGALCLKKTIAPGESAEFPFLLGWHFPNRTPEWCGWQAPEGEGKTILGNHYSTRFKSAWEAVSYAATNLESLESRTRAFASAFAESTLPAPVKDAASANLSTLASTTCFRTADGEFHAFEGSDDNGGCCFGNCTHVWNYETVTPFLFPTFARSLRKSAFGYSMDEAGAMQFRQLLPEGKERSGFAAADGQMGQIIHAWLDWKLSGDANWLRDLWPRIRKALEFAWVPGGWDANKDGVLEGVQHNTYDVEFYGPNPMCGIYYLGALRAGEEMARAMGETAPADEYQRLAARGARWIDANLFNGEYYIQKIQGFRKDQIAPNLRSDMGADDPEKPEYQVGNGCMIDQLIGQYLVEVGGMGALVSPENIRTAARSMFRFNYKPSLEHYESMARTYVLNDEAAIVVCDYGKSERPRIPFPYYAEAWTGLEYSTAALFMHWGMVDEGLQIVRDIRSRYDGEKRNPWDEPECGHHYARAMSSWSTIIALSGWVYDGPRGAVTALPRLMHEDFQCFWATATGWGSFRYRNRAGGTQFTLKVLAGALPFRSVEIAATGGRVSASADGRTLATAEESKANSLLIRFSDPVTLPEHGELRVEVLP